MPESYDQRRWERNQRTNSEPKQQRSYPSFYENFSESDPFPFTTLLMDYGEKLYPGEGFCDCISAKNTLLNIYNELGDEEKPYQFDKLSRLRSAIGDRLSDISGDTQERRILDFMHVYLDGIKDFLKVRDDPEDDPCENPEKLSFYVSYFERLKGGLDRIEQPGREELERRADLAVEWCRKHLATISRIQPRAANTEIQANIQSQKTHRTGCFGALLIGVGILLATIHMISR